MILPRWRIPKWTTAGRYRIESAFTASYQPTAVKVMGIFESRTRRQRQRTARRAAAGRMGARFAARQFPARTLDEL